jgi:hypothetical protein
VGLLGPGFAIVFPFKLNANLMILLQAKSGFVVAFSSLPSFGE